MPASSPVNLLTIGRDNSLEVLNVAVDFVYALMAQIVYTPDFFPHLINDIDLSGHCIRMRTSCKPQFRPMRQTILPSTVTTPVLRQ